MPLLVSFSILGSTKRSLNSISDLLINKFAPATYIEADVKLEIDASNEGDVVAQSLPVIAGYDWVAHKVRNTSHVFVWGINCPKVST